MGMGVLITGESGIGKSELALDLLSRNHRLISDDAVELVRVGPDVIVGQSPHALSDYLEVRGLGILDVRLMFGETAVRHRKRLHLIVHLQKLNKRRMVRVDRLQTLSRTRKILDTDISEVILYVAPGRNLAVLVESATRAYILRMWGINPLEEFMKRHQALMNGEARPDKDRTRKSRLQPD
jgi:HPr kinase/phosphorylase